MMEDERVSVAVDECPRETVNFVCTAADLEAPVPAHETRARPFEAIAPPHAHGDEIGDVDPLQNFDWNRLHCGHGDIMDWMVLDGD